MQQILSRKTTKNSRINLITKTIGKPKPLPRCSCSITADGPSLFYTFDGRALFFSADQEEPIISLPDETRKVVFPNTEDNAVIFLLSAKNKLECCDFTPTLSENRYIVTRNVVQIEKSCGKVFYMFKKDQHHFINECIFNGKKWIGQIAMINIEGSAVKLFASNGTFFYTVESKVFDSTGTYLGFCADFVYRYGDLMVTGIQKSGYYEISLLSVKTSYSIIESFNMQCSEVAKITAHHDLLIFQNLNELNLFKISTDTESFGIKYNIKHDYDVFDYDFSIVENSVYLYILADSKHFDSIDAILDSNIESYNITKLSTDNIKCFDGSFDLHSAPERANSGKSIANLGSRQSSPTKVKPDFDVNDADFFYDSLPTKKSSILREMESMSLAPSNSDMASEPKPRNNLLEEVRATLSKKKLSAQDQDLKQVEEPVKPIQDRFELYKSMSSDAASAPEIQLSKDENTYLDAALNGRDAQIHSKIHLNDKHSQYQLVDGAFSKENTSNLINPSDMMNVLNSIDKSLCEIRQYYKQTQSAIQSLSFREDQIRSLLKNIIVEALVPSVEACFNEMRIQMQTELKKILSSATRSAEDPKICLIKKHLTSGKPAQAIIELLKLDEKEIAANLSLFTPASIENVESNVLFMLLSKIYSLLQKSSSDLYFDLIYYCLVDIEIDDLSVENLQELSIMLRNIRETESFNKEKYSDLSCVIDIISKRIRKRARRDSSK
ncbi:uncharacterized protein VICG_00458 [Vittaforma corneae ATCC 50505]|uniref:Uncharacterized protein n=1 Tax=Vittaforma corneae (strain ATCC 50505) TaxID=993615 RepID=L2GPB7_VITCO|nr:uncharacterized protein VICG_00458 [Vittaforma corneae ATCC 50505]ELA42360.1 hypothetical protein VICG_00458 [Vittaforma corneae ATCC 50505]